MPLTGTAASVGKKVGHSAALQGWSINVGLGQKTALQQQQQSAAGVLLKSSYIFNISVSVLVVFFPSIDSKIVYPPVHIVCITIPCLASLLLCAGPCVMWLMFRSKHTRLS